jgi:predicted MFS family arabinose efflux permease
MSQSDCTITSSEQKSFWSLALASLGYRDFRLVWTGSVVEHAGEFMEVAAILWLTNELTHSPLWLTIVGSCRFITMIFFPIIGGVVADRVNRRGLLMAALMGSALLSGLLAFLAATKAINLTHLIIVSLAGGVVMSFNHPARQTIVPNLVKKEHLLNAVSMDTLSVHMSRAIGVPISGYLIEMVGVWPIFLIRAFGCLVAISLLLFAWVPPTPSATRAKAPWHNLMDGFRYLKGNTAVLILVSLYALPLLAQNTFLNFLPVFANEIWNVGAVGYGYLQGAPGLGAVVSLFILGLMTYYRNKFSLLIGSGLILATSLLIFPASPWFPLALFLTVAVGGMVTAFVAVETTLIQSIIPDQVRGRVLSWREVLFGLGPTGSIFFGAIAQNTGVPISLAIAGGVCLFVSFLLILLFPRFRGTG